MRQGNPGQSSATALPGTLSDPELVGSALCASDIALWELSLEERTLTLSDSIYRWVPELGEIADETQLLALMPPADQYLFQQTFSRNRQGDGPASCEVCLAGLASQPRLRFIGRRHRAESGYDYCVGAVVSSQHWLANPGPEYVQSLLSRLFAESPIASFVTDPDGVMLECNHALEALLQLTPRQSTAGIGRYRVLHDRVLQARPDLLSRVRRVFQRGEIQCFDVDYPLGNVHRNALFVDQRVPLRVSFLPMRDRHGEVTRVLIQCQDRSGEQSAHQELQHRDQLLYSLINNSHNLVSIKSLEGKYLLVNDSFARWVGRDADELCGQSDADLFPGPVAERRRAQEQALLSGALPSEVEEVLPGPDGRQYTFVCVRFPIEGPDGARRGIGQIMTDITRQKAIEHSLQSQRQELRLLLDSMRAGIGYFDRWGLVKDFNELARALLGPALQVGKSFLEIAPHWDSPEERQRELMQVVRTGEAQLNSIENAQSEGERHWFSVDKIPTKNNQGYVNGVLLVVNDITDSVLRERALSQSEARYRAFIANSSEAIWRYDMLPPVSVELTPGEQEAAIVRNARLAEGNRVLAQIMGAPSVESLLGTGLRETGSSRYRFDVKQFIVNGYQLIDYEIARRDPRGRGEIHFQISCVGEVENGHLCRVWGTSKDITARKRYEEKLEYQATHDALTRLPNRTRLYREMEHWLKQADGRKAALLLIDLDRFKEINDTLGHSVGDQLLSQIGPRLSSEMADTPGVVARLGGDEFAIFLPDIRHHRQALVFGHRVLDALRNEFVIEGYTTEISASIGISMSPDQASDVSTLMRYADVAMYCAKSEMTGVALYDGEKDPHSPQRLSLINELGRAIREDQLCLHFQPKIELDGQRCFGLEALLRWQHPALGMISPAEFIPIAEATNLIHPLTNWVLKQSIRACCDWHDAGFPLSVAVNLSARNLMDDTLPRQVELLLKEYGLPHWALELEITESSIMTDPRRAMTNLERLHALGICLSIDDFGTGYSSLAYLKRLPVQTLKIDFSFVRQMLDDEQDEIIVKSTIHLAHNLGLNVVAEGVESEALLRRLQDLECDLAQGFHIGRPMPETALQSWLTDSRWVERPRSSHRN